VLRIVGGVAKGRRIAVPPAGTRPTADRAREAMFSTLATLDAVAGARVLDLYAGSGAVGLEALSRGASHALLVESDRKVLSVLRSNVATLGVPGAQVAAGSVATVLAVPPSAPYDLLFADPPYALAAGDLQAVLEAARAWLSPDAVVVIERSARDPAWQWPDGFEPLFSRRYGEATLWYAQHAGDPGA
jgi:16S rRNA (guanine966-N2)-methyltransferase